MENQGANLWIGDKKGNVHVHDAASLDEKHCIEGKHQKEITVIGSNSKMVASCDGFRETNIWSAEDFSHLNNSAYHKSKVFDCYMTEEQILTVSLDKDLCLRGLGDFKPIKEEKNVHGTRDVEQGILHKNHAVTQGRDCALRQWAV